MTIYLGFDPEFQPLDAKGKPIMAHKAGFPVKFPEAWSFRDGANIELNIPAKQGAVHCRENLEVRFQSALKDAMARLGEGKLLGSFAAYEVSKKDVRDAPDDVKQFGCKPSFDAYTGETKICPLDGENHFWRYAGGHMHFSVSADAGPEAFGKENPIWKALVDPEGQKMFVKLCDLLIGVPLTFLYDDEGQFRRREWYGQAGEYRPQQYGVVEEKKYLDLHDRPVEYADIVNKFGCACDACLKKYAIGSARYKSVGTGIFKPTYIGVEYRVPPPQLFNHQGVMSLFFGVGRHIVRNFGYYAKRWKKGIEPAVREAINTGVGTERLLQTVPHWYSPESLMRLKVQKDIHTFNTVRQGGAFGWEHFRNVWGIDLPPAGKVPLLP